MQRVEAIQRLRPDCRRPRSFASAARTTAEAAYSRSPWPPRDSGRRSARTHGGAGGAGRRKRCRAPGRSRPWRAHGPARRRCRRLRRRGRGWSAARAGGSRRRRPADDDVGALAALQEVVAGAAVHTIAAAPAVEDVVAGAAIEAVAWRADPAVGVQAVAPDESSPGPPEMVSEPWAPRSVSLRSVPVARAPASGPIQVTPVDASGTGAASTTCSQSANAPARRLCALEMPPGWS